jgi:hypothetical protein
MKLKNSAPKIVSVSVENFLPKGTMSTPCENKTRVGDVCVIDGERILVSPDTCVSSCDDKKFGRTRLGLYD